MPSAPPATRTLSLGDLLVTAGTLVVFSFSFAPFVQYNQQALDSAVPAEMSSTFNAWSAETFMIPLTTFVIVAALLGLAAAWTRFGMGRDPRVLGFRLRQLEVGLSLFGFVVLLGMVASDKHVFFGVSGLNEADREFLGEVGLEVGWGGVLMLVGAALALAGTVLNHLGLGPVVAANTPPAQPGAPPAHDTAPPAHGTAPPAHGTAPPAHGTAPPAHGTAPPARGTAPPPAGGP